MERPYILHMITPLKHISPFDVNMALDAGFNAVVPYTGVELGEVTGLVQDAIFSRTPKDAERTGVFIGGRDAILALDMLETAKKAMVPPFQISVFADPAGSFTTAAAMVACVEAKLKQAHEDELANKRVLVFGATGIVGFAAGVIAGQEGAKVTLAGYDGSVRVAKRAAAAKERFKIELNFADASSDALKKGLLKDAEIILCAGRAGTQVLTRSQVGAAKALKVVADINAVPPAGIEGVGVSDNGAAIENTGALGIGALAIGNIKYQVERAMFEQMRAAEKPQYLDFTHAFQDARDRVG
jgi:methylene-tetrahydromethanopterin dehydrogenase